MHVDTIKGAAGLLALVLFFVAAWQHNSPFFTRLLALGLAALTLGIML